MSHSRWAKERSTDPSSTSFAMDHTSAYRSLFRGRGLVWANIWYAEKNSENDGFPFAIPLHAKLSDMFIDHLGSCDVDFHLGLLDDDTTIDKPVETPALQQNDNQDIKIDETKLITPIEFIEDVPSILAR
eukprot:5416592-Pyramimonas_sp.AAC.1